MKVCVLNACPKGNSSITLQYVRYISKHALNDTFKVINIGQFVTEGTFPQKKAVALSIIKECDVILFSFPVYNALPPSQLMTFFESLSNEEKEVFRNKKIVKISTSKHSFDNMAHKYIDLVCSDYDALTLKGYSADFDDILTKKGQTDLLRYWKYVQDMYRMSGFEASIKKQPSPVAAYERTHLEVNAKTNTYNIVIVTDKDIDELEAENPSLSNMIKDYISASVYKITVLNISKYLDKGCFGCLSCCRKGKCVQADGFQQVHEEIIKNADAVIFAAEIKNHYLGSVFKKYDDREYYNGNRMLGKVKAFGYILSGSYQDESLLKTLLEARAEQHYVTFAGVASDDYNTAEQLGVLRTRIEACIENQFSQSGGFYLSAKTNAFGGLISDMRGIMKKDFKFFKENGFYSNHLKSAKKVVTSKILDVCMSLPKIGPAVASGFTEGISAAQKKVARTQVSNSEIIPEGKKKVLLIAPDLKVCTEAPPLPIGLLSIGTYLTDNGYSVRLINRSIEKVDIDKLVKEYKPDIVGISVISVQTLKDSVKLSKKLHDMGLKIVWGGPLASSIPAVILEEAYVDFVVIGEGEQTWLELMENMPDNKFDEIDGLAFKSENGIVINKDREPLSGEMLPVINYNFTDISKYLVPHFDCEKMLWVSAGKGCPGNCAFCYNKAFNKCKYRKRPMENVLEEIRTLSVDYGLDGVSFSDELFFANREEMHKTCDKIRESGIDFVWGCFLRIDNWTREDFDYMYNSGCRWILFGVESGSAKILKRIHKGIDLDKIEPVIKNCYEAGIPPWASFIIGFPGETVEDVKETVKLGQQLAKYRCRIGFNYYTPVMGSDLYNDLIADGRKKKVEKLSDLLRTSWNTFDENYSEVPSRDLKALSAYASYWSAKTHFFNRQNVQKTGPVYWVLKVVKALISLYKNEGPVTMVRWIYSMFITFVPAFFTYNFAFRIKKKYGIYI